MTDSKNAYKGFFDSWMDFNTKMMQSGISTMREYWTPESYENFYSSWSKHYSEMMEKIMRLPGFTEKSWETFKSTTGFQKFSEMMAQQYLKSVNVPTREEIDELSQRISYLDDKMEIIEEKLDSLLEKTAV